MACPYCGSNKASWSDCPNCGARFKGEAADYDEDYYMTMRQDL